MDINEGEPCSMTQELTNSYRVKDLNEDEFEISIIGPQKYKTLWMTKLSELRTTLKEITEFQK